MLLLTSCGVIKFKACSDHITLKFLLTCKGLKTRLAKWSLRLKQSLQFKLQYRKCRQHSVKAVNALTRDPLFRRISGDNPPTTGPMLLEDEGEPAQCSCIQSHCSEAPLEFHTLKPAHPKPAHLIEHWRSPCTSQTLLATPSR